MSLSGWCRQLANLNQSCQINDPVNHYIDINNCKYIFVWANPARLADVRLNRDVNFKLIFLKFYVIFTYLQHAPLALDISHVVATHFCRALDIRVP